jgi:tryptophan synthase alpha chain
MAEKPQEETLPAQSVESGIASLSEALQRRSQAGQTVVAPFLTAGDPDFDFTFEALVAAERSGATLCELGVPYSDPIADGPVIQASYTRALNAGASLEGVLGVARRASSQLSMPLVAMTSYSIIFRRGIERFVDEAIAAGLTGLIVPDLPIEESQPLSLACEREHLALVRLVTPTTPPERAERIARESTGFLYCVSVAGVTGERTDLPHQLRDRLLWLKERADVPILVGFGISRPEQVRQIGEVADGVIVGSALVRHLEGPSGQRLSGDSRAAALSAIERHVADLVAAAG